MTAEPTADEINRAIAEWMGWAKIRLFYPDRVLDDRAPYYIGRSPNNPQFERPIPDYTSSLDAQIPAWEALRARHYEVIIYACGDAEIEYPLTGDIAGALRGDTRGEY